MRRFLYSFLIIIFSVFSLHSFSQVSKAEATINEIMQQNGVVGLGIAVVKKGKLFYTHSFGLNNKERNEALTDNDLFRIASISKSFSATAIMQLVEAKKLSLNDDVSKLIGFNIRNPKFPNTVITVRMILSHLSSINDSQGYFNLDDINPAKNPDWQKCYNDYEPGKGYEYCNLNFNLAGTIIERTSGERFDHYIQRHIIQPLGLYGGFWVDGLDSTRFVTLYDYDDSLKTLVPQPMAYNPRREEIANYVVGYSTPVFSAAGGMKISAQRSCPLHDHAHEAGQRRQRKTDH